MCGELIWRICIESNIVVDDASIHYRYNNSSWYLSNQFAEEIRTDSVHLIANFS
jgi:hypothetical protein